MGITNTNVSMNPQSEIATQNQDGEVSYYIIKSDVSSWLMKGFESGFEHLPSLSDKISYILSAVKIYGDIGYLRKQGFFLHYLGQLLKEDFHTVCRKNNIAINPLRFGSPITYKSIIKSRINRNSSGTFSSNYRQSFSRPPILPPHKEIIYDEPTEANDSSFNRESNNTMSNRPIAAEEETMEPDDISDLHDYSDFKNISFMSNPQTPGVNNNNNNNNNNKSKSKNNDRDQSQERDRHDDSKSKDDNGSSSRHSRSDDRDHKKSKNKMDKDKKKDKRSRSSNQDEERWSRKRSHNDNDDNQKSKRRHNL